MCYNIFLTFLFQPCFRFGGITEKFDTSSVITGHPASHTRFGEFVNPLLCGLGTGILLGPEVMLAFRPVGVFTENQFPGICPALDKVEAGFAECLTYGLVGGSFGMLENLRQFIFGLQLRQFRLIGLVIPSDARVSDRNLYRSSRS